MSDHMQPYPSLISAQSCRNLAIRRLSAALSLAAAAQRRAQSLSAGASTDIRCYHRSQPGNDVSRLVAAAKTTKASTVCGLPATWPRRRGRLRGLPGTPLRTSPRPPIAARRCGSPAASDLLDPSCACSAEPHSQVLPARSCPLAERAARAEPAISSRGSTWCYFARTAEPASARSLAPAVCGPVVKYQIAPPSLVSFFPARLQILAPLYPAPLTLTRPVSPPGSSPSLTSFPLRLDQATR